MFSVKSIGYIQGINRWLNPQLKNWRPLTVVKLTTEILITNTNIYAYSETTFSEPTIVYGMTEKLNLCVLPYLRRFE